MRIKDAFALSDKGPERNWNEDAVLKVDAVPLYALADGMGGRGVGDRAAELAIDLVETSGSILKEHAEALVSDRSTSARLELGHVLEALLAEVHDRIDATAHKGGQRGMATTLVTAMISGNHAYIAHVGDSRAWLYRAGTLRLLTEDHTVGMLRFKQGRLTADELKTSPLRRRLYQVLGAGNEIDVDTAEVQLADDDVLLLTSDGIHGAVGKDAIKRCLADAPDAQTACRKLVRAAWKAKTDDNVSAVVVRVGLPDDAASVDAIAEVLGGVFLFERLSRAELLMLAPYLEQKRLAAGDVLFREGDDGDDFFAVVSGTVRITRGHTHLVDVGPGGHFGELGLARVVPRSATVTAVDDTLIYGLHRDRFLAVARRRPSLGNRITLALLDTVGNRLRDLTDRLDIAEQVVRGDRRPEGMTVREALTAAIRGQLE